MISKDKILKADIYKADGSHLLTTKAITFPRDFFKVKGYELVSIRSTKLPVIRKNDELTVVFEYSNGTRIRCKTKVDISTSEQMNFHVDDGEVLEERRNSYKVATKEPAYIIRLETQDDTIDLEEPFKVTILNINLSGILMHSDMELKIGDIVTIKLLNGNMELRTEILRRQFNNDGELVGYGCRFLDVTPSQEEKIARHLFECQLAERDRKKNESR